MHEYSLSSTNAITQNSSGGRLLKWRVDGRYIKTSTFIQESLQPKFMYESYAEVIAYKIAKRLGYDCVKYELCKVTIDNKFNTTACVSEEFKPNGFEELSIAKVLRMNKNNNISINQPDTYTKLINKFRNIPRFKDYIDRLIIFDSIILNDDRHFGNFGFLVNSERKIMCQPIFDNGNSLFCHKYIDDIEYTPGLEDYLQSKPFNRFFNTQLELVDKNNIPSKEKLEDLKRYIPDMVKNIGRYGLPKNRVKFIVKLLECRIDYLLYLIE